MNMKTFKGKAIYHPAGKAAEYAKYACNFYVGCSNQCEYCYLRKGIGKATLGGAKPTLKKCFKDESDALRVFEKELKYNLPELREHGLFFSFTTDPMLFETKYLTLSAMNLCNDFDIPVKILTKRADWIDDYLWLCDQMEYANGSEIDWSSEKIAFGFTLTGHDELEPYASTNAERIEAMRKLHDAGFNTFASIEPVIDVDDSFHQILFSYHYCDLFKIGLESGKRYNKYYLKSFINAICELVDCEDAMKSKIYFKDSLLKAAGIRREDLPANCVTRDYNIFNDK
jgi:DNA repair photolyase